MFKKVLFSFIILINLVFFLNPPLTFAGNPKNCNTAGVGPDQDPSFIPEGAPEVKFSFHNLPKNQNFYWKALFSSDEGGGFQSKVAEKSNDDGKLTISITESRLFDKNGNYLVELWQSGSKEAFCNLKYTVGYQFNYDTCQIDAPDTVTIGQDIIVNISNAPRVPPVTVLRSDWEWPVYFGDEFITKITISPEGTANFIIPGSGYKTPTKRELYLSHPNQPVIESDRFCITKINIISSTSPPTPRCKISPSNPKIIHDVTLNAVNLPKNEIFIPKLSFNGTEVPGLVGGDSGSQGIVQLMLVKKGGAVGNYKVTLVNSSRKDEKVPGCEQSFSIDLPNTPITIERCGDLGVICSSSGGEGCEDKKDGRGPAMKTAIGCIHTSPAEFVKDFMKFIIAISSGLAFLLMLLGAFQMLTSAGNPDSLNAGRERLTSAVIGLLFLIFAVLLMQIIGVSILCIPGFGQCK